MKIKEVKIGHRFQHGIKGEGVVIDKTARTITAKFLKSTTKIRYYISDPDFLISDF